MRLWDPTIRVIICVHSLFPNAESVGPYFLDKEASLHSFIPHLRIAVFGQRTVVNAY